MSHRICKPPLWVLAFCLLGAWAPGVSAQELEPRSYSNAPIGLNFLIAGYAHTSGNVAFDPAVPITDADLRTNSAVLAYARVFDAWGRCAKFDAVVPYTWLDGSADVAGQPRTRQVSGFADPRLRIAVNFVGAPALSLREFPGYRPGLIVGGSLQVTAPWGQYDDEKLVNIGTNRWSFKPELGISQSWGSWSLELTPSVTFYTDNTDFLNGGTLEQAPLYAVQSHLVRTLPFGIWVALDATYYRGARTTVNGERGDTLQEATRVGATLALPVGRHHSVKLYASTGTSSRTGSDFDAFGVAWQYRWGEGF